MFRTALPALLFVLGCVAAPAGHGESVKAVYWSDGDSGRVNGIAFRLADVDAPETGGVGSLGGAKCEKERELGFKAKEFIVNATKAGTLTITSTEQKDDFGRTVMTLAINGKDIGQMGIAAGILRPYVFVGRRATMPKSKWCP